MKKFDVIVIGSGGAGSKIAFTCNSNHMEVAVIDYRPLGGTCANRGCDPKKVLWGAAEPVEISTNLDTYSQPLKLDWNKLIKFKKTFTDPVPQKREKSFNDAGISIFKGKASFTAQNRLMVNGKELEGKYIVIATGAKPKPLDMPGESLVTTSDEFLETSNLPPEIIFIGGGYISFEFAHIASRAGAKVKILHIDDKPLQIFDQDIVGKLLDITREAGIEFIPNSPAKSFSKDGRNIVVHTENRKYSCGMAVHGAGRIPEIDELNLEKGMVEYGKGIKLNKFLQSISNEAVYAAGDCAQTGPPLTPVAGIEAAAVAENIIKGNRVTLDYSVVPSVVFTIPPLASVGLSEKQAKDKNIDYKANFMDISKWYNSRRLGFRHTAFKVIEEKGTGKIIGAHLIYPQSEDIINLFSLAMKNNMPLENIKETIFSYPSNTSDIKYMF
ncbi:MAG: NAD(P)/FAD-dependent oxidoreductase [Candidatus Humimicrobiaceae bacterium]